MPRDNTRRRTWWRAGAMLLLPLLAGAAACGGAASEDASGFDVMEKSVRDLTGALERGEVTSVELVDAYLARIAAFDQQGPAINAMVTINPNARDVARGLDQERSEGRIRGALHGIPVLVKDNYDTADMPTSAGTLALATSVPPDDSAQVARLRAAGAIILGKTNMHELARGITTVASFGGQTRNPYDPERNPGGSSGGTGAAVAASFGAFGMGSDTCGSIRIPSAHHHLVGLRGTRGLASGDGIIPLSTTQDIGGPLTRSVEDLALALDATVGPDPADPATLAGNGQIPVTYTAFLDADALAGARLGVVDALLGSGAAERPVRAVIERAVEEMERLGATAVEITEPDLAELVQGGSVIRQEFRFDMNAYLEATPGAPVRTLAQIVDTGLYHEIMERGLADTLQITSRETDDYRESLAQRDTVRDTVIELMDEQELDALIYPTIRQTARPIGQPQQGSNCALSAVSGLPALTMPAGEADDAMPVGLEMLARPWEEPRLIALAYAWEQHAPRRRPPAFTPSLVSPPAPVVLESRVTAEEGLSARARFTLDPSTRTLDYDVTVYGLRWSGPEDEVLSVALHRRGPAEDAERGPVVRQLARRGGARTAGQVRLSGVEMHALRADRLYLAVHTREHLVGAVRIDVGLPGAGE